MHQTHHSNSDISSNAIFGALDDNCSDLISNAPSYRTIQKSNFGGNSVKIYYGEKPEVPDLNDLDEEQIDILKSNKIEQTDKAEMEKHDQLYESLPEPPRQGSLEKRREVEIPVLI